MRSTEPFPCGIKQLYVAPDCVADIVFVHGLNGDREKTWMAEKSRGPWPELLLPSKVPNARVLTFGYDAYVAHLYGVVSQTTIGNHGMNLLNALTTFRSFDKTETRPIIFVAHSLGGLVCEDALISSRQRPEKHLRSILESTRGIIFLGTPLRGTGLAKWAETLASSIGIVKKTNSKLLNTLRRDSEVLARIQDGFHSMIRSREKDGCPPIEITCFFEQLPTQRFGMVVPQDSATLPGYNAIGIQADHREMAKFENDDNPGFLLIVGELLRWVGQLKGGEKKEWQQQELSESPSTPYLSIKSSVHENITQVTLLDDQYYEFSNGEQSRQEMEGQITAMLGGTSIGKLDTPRGNTQLEKFTIEPLRIGNQQISAPISLTATHAISVADTYDDTEQYDQAGREAFAAGKWELAMRMFKASVNGKESQLPKDLKAAESRKLYAEALLKNKEYGLAEALSRQVLMWTEKNHGNLVLMSQARHLLACALEKCNFLDEAREEFKKAAIGFEAASGGEDSYQSLSSRYRHGILASNHEAYDMSWGYWSVAKTSLQRAAEGMSRLLGQSHKDTLMSKVAYAKVLLKTCQDQEAYQKFLEVLRIARNTLPSDHPVVQEIVSDLNECQTSLKRFRTWTPAERLKDARKRKQKSTDHQLRRQKTGHW